MNLKQLKINLLVTVFAFVGAAAQADLITVTNSAGGVVDRSSITQLLNVVGGGSIVDVNVTVDFSTCSAGADLSGCIGESGFTFNREIVFELTFGGTNVALVSQDTFSGETGNVRITQTYDDAAATAVGGATLLNGTFSPVGLLNAFNGIGPAGDWSFRFADTVGLDPMVVHSWRLDITTAPVPEPGPSRYWESVYLEWVWQNEGKQSDPRTRIIRKPRLVRGFLSVI